MAQRPPPLVLVTAESSSPTSSLSLISHYSSDLTSSSVTASPAWCVTPDNDCPRIRDSSLLQQPHLVAIVLVQLGLELVEVLLALDVADYHDGAAELLAVVGQLAESTVVACFLWSFYILSQKVRIQDVWHRTESLIFAPDP